MDVCSQILTSWRDWRVWSGGEDVLRELMAILDTTAQEIVSLTRSEFRRRGGVAAAAAGVGVKRPNIAEVDKRLPLMAIEALHFHCHSHSH